MCNTCVYAIENMKSKKRFKQLQYWGGVDTRILRIKIRGEQTSPCLDRACYFLFCFGLFAIGSQVMKTNKQRKHGILDSPWPTFMFLLPTFYKTSQPCPHKLSSNISTNILLTTVDHPLPPMPPLLSLASLSSLTSYVPMGPIKEHQDPYWTLWHLKELGTLNGHWNPYRRTILCPTKALLTPHDPHYPSNGFQFKKSN